MKASRTDKKWTKGLTNGLTKAQKKEEQEMKDKTEKRLAFFLSRV